MERITYRKTLDVHKNGIQFLLQGFETADNMSRVIEISLMASGDAIDFPLERIEALMFVTTPNATEPSINKCTIKDNKVVYDVLPIVEEGITSMQLKIIETSPDGATAILATPKFAVEVTKSDTDDESVKQTTTFTALEDAVAKAKATYDARLLRIELTSDCLFRAYYAGEMPNEHGAIYETDILQKLFLNGNVLLSESFAHGGTGVRAGEDTDNSKYYSNVSKSEALNAKSIMENSEEILEKVRLHGTYTAFSVDFTTGEVEYVSPSYTFTVNKETGELEAEEQAYTFLDEIGVLTTRWLETQNIFLNELKETSGTHTTQIATLERVSETHTEDVAELKKKASSVTPIELGGTGADNATDALKNLGGASIQYVDNNILHFEGTAIVVDGDGTAADCFLLPEDVDFDKYIAFLSSSVADDDSDVVHHLPWDELIYLARNGLSEYIRAKISKTSKLLEFSYRVSGDGSQTIKFNLFLVPMAESITLTAKTL